MKDFEYTAFDFKKCLQEIQDFKTLLNSKQELSEQKDILPFFKRRKNLSAFIGTLNPKIEKHDRLAYEFDMWGDFKTDLAIGCSKSNAYCFVEFENASHDSIFRKVGNKSTNDWSPRFEHGFSQIIDWFYKLDDQRSTRDFRDKFGGEDVTYIGFLIIGRSQFISEKDRGRLNWRSDKMIVNSVPIFCLTFDKLYEMLENRLNSIRSFISAYES